MGKIKNTRFSEKNYKRAGGGISFEERAAQPSDFTRGRNYTYAKEYADSPSTFDLTYPNWQAFADCFIMRRAVITITGRQTCDSEEFLANEIESYTDPDFATVKNFATSGVRSADTIPKGRYLNTGMNFSDLGNRNTNIDVSYVQYREWQLIKLIDETPDPKGGA